MNERNTIELILDLLRQKGIKPAPFEKELGLANASVSAWVKGKANPSTDALTKIADYFNVSVDYLLCRTEDPLIQSPESVPIAFHDDGHEVTEEELDNAMKIIRRYQEQQEKKK